MKLSDYYNGCFKDDGSVEIMTLSEFICSIPKELYELSSDFGAVYRVNKQVHEISMLDNRGALSHLITYDKILLSEANPQIELLGNGVCTCIKNVALVIIRTDGPGLYNVFIIYGDKPKQKTQDRKSLWRDFLSGKLHGVELDILDNGDGFLCNFKM